MRLAVCEEHLELGIDIFVDETERAPNVIDLQRDNMEQDSPLKGDNDLNETLGSRCARCDRPPRYLLV